MKVKQRTGFGTIVLTAVLAAAAGTATAQSQSDEAAKADELSRKSNMQRVLVRQSDGTTSVMWVRSPTQDASRGGARISSPMDSLTGGDGAEPPKVRAPIGFQRPDSPRRPLEGGADRGDPITGEPAPPPGGNGGGGGEPPPPPPPPPGGGGGGGVPSGEIIYPGSGFSGPTAQPPAIGSPGQYGYDAKAIAKWDVVPYQIIDSTFNVGVVAFHMAGMDRVEFIAEGGTPVAIGEPSLNPRTGVIEYWATIQASDFQDGKVELRAIAYPLVGEPRVLDTLELYSNHHGGIELVEVFVDPVTGSDNAAGSRSAPFRSVERALVEFKRLRTPSGASGPAESGFITLLREDFYLMPTHNNTNGGAGPYTGSIVISPDSWITIRADAGLERSQVILGSEHRENMRCMVDKLAFNGVTLDFDRIKSVYAEPGDFLWFDNAEWYNPRGQTADYSTITSPVRTHKTGVSSYATNSYAHDWLYGFTNQLLVRNCKMERISGDALQNSLMVVNVDVDGIDGNVRAHHSDLLQYFGNYENIIVYGVKATNINRTQNFFLDHYQSSFTNCAFVNVAVQNLTGGGAPFTQLNSAHDHVLFWHISNPMQRWVFRDDFSGAKQFTANNVVFKNNVFEQLARAGWNNPGLPPGVEVSSNHFVDSDFAHGSNQSIGVVRIQDGVGAEFDYTGSGVSRIVGSAEPIADLIVPDWAYADPGSPNRGAFPFSQETMAGN